MTAAIILALASLSLIVAAIVNESGRRVGGITFYSLGRYRFTICKAQRAALCPSGRSKRKAKP